MITLREAVEALDEGRLVVLPTDTVYGIAARFDAPGGVRAVFEAKGRSVDKPLPVLGSDLEALRRVASFDVRAEALAARFWPGPLTLVLPRAPDFEVDLGGSATDSVAVRVPRNDVAVELLRQAGPLAVSSANRSDQSPAVTVEEARTALGESVAVFIDGGVMGGRPSTIVSLLDDLRMIREGEVAFVDIQASMS